MDIVEKFNKLLLIFLSGKEKEIKQIYYDAILDITPIAAKMPYRQTAFNMRLYPVLSKRINSVLERMQTKIYGTVVNGIDGAWQLSEQKNTVYINKQLKDVKVPEGLKKIYYDPNEKAKDAFKSRTEGGLKLSDRVWNIANGYRNEIEVAVAEGIANGTSAQDMAKKMQGYLNEPDRLYRNVKKNGKVKLSEKAADYHPGQGIYRSSYKNALRLARNETNMAYRKADYEKWKALDFVVGIQISLSNNHPAKPENEMCEHLAGKYPKDFQWTGWHVQCLCHATPIFITPNEKNDRRKALLNGEKWKGRSDNEIKDAPKSYYDWLADNEGRIKALSSKPYFLKDNPDYENYENDSK